MPTAREDGMKLRKSLHATLLGLGASGIVVDEPEVVSKSWPGFWSMIEGLR